MRKCTEGWSEAKAAPRERLTQSVAKCHALFQVAKFVVFIGTVDKDRPFAYSSSPLRGFTKTAGELTV